MFSPEKIFEIKDILEDHTEYVEILSIRNKYEENTLKKEHINSVRAIDIELRTSQEEKEKKQSRYCCPQRGQEIPEEHRQPPPTRLLPETRQKHLRRPRPRDPLPVTSPPRSPGSLRSLHRRRLRGHQPLCHPRQAHDCHEEGHGPRKKNPWRQTGRLPGPPAKDR